MSMEFESNPTQPGGAQSGVQGAAQAAQNAARNAAQTAQNAAQTAAHVAQDAAHRAAETGKRAVAEADRVWRENPVPVVLGALAVGLVIGVLIYSSHEPTPRSRAEELKDRLSDAEDYLSDILSSVGKKTSKGYRKSAVAAKDALQRAADLAHDAEEDYVEPASKWFRSLWKRCCS